MKLSLAFTQKSCASPEFSQGNAESLCSLPWPITCNRTLDGGVALVPLQEISTHGEPDGRRALVSVTKSEAAYREIRSWILDGTLTPGEIVDQEVLAASLGLSTTPVREALRRLEAERLVTLEAHRHMRVATMTPADVRDLYAVRIELDPLAAELAARFATKADIEKAQELADLSPADALDRLAVNRSLHSAIYQACDNPVLIQVLESLWDRSDRCRMLLVTDELENKAALDEHAEIVEAFAKRKGKQLRTLMRNHLVHGLDHLTSLPPSSWPQPTDVDDSSAALKS